MTLEELKHLKDVCAKATPEDWGAVLKNMAEAGATCPLPVAYFLATFNPTQVAELLELAEEQIRYLRWRAYVRG